MLTGRPPFAGETVSDVIVAILEREPDWSALPKAMPTGVRRLLQRCLEKDLKRRQRDIGDARIELDEAVAAPMTATTRSERRPSSVRAAWTVAALCGALALTAAGFIYLDRPVDLRVVRMSILPPAALLMGSVPAYRLAISPDGQRLAFTDTGADGRALLWQISMQGGEAPRWRGDGKELFYVTGKGSWRRL